MLGSELIFDFYIHPGQALLLLEAEDCLAYSPPEDSSLRRSAHGTSKDLRIVWDTRKLPPPSAGEQVIFIARKTERFDSHSSVAELLNAGHIVVAQYDCLNSSGDGRTDNPQNLWTQDLVSHPCLISVLSTEKARNLIVQSASKLQAREWTTLAITGTNGKTSTTQSASAMLEELSQKVVLRLGTLGIQIAGQTYDNPFPTQPDFPGLLAALSTASQHFSCRQLVMEATSIGLVEGRLGHWPVGCGAFLNLSQDHLDYHGTMERYLQAKLELFRNHLASDGHVVVNVEDPHCLQVIQAAAGKSRLCVGFGRSKNRDRFFDKATPLFSSIRFLETSHQHTSVQGISGQWTLWLDKPTSVAQCQYSVKLLGEVQHENVTAGAAMMLSLGYPLTQIGGVCQQIRPIHGRLEPVAVSQTTHGPNVLVDYAHSPDALEKTLRTCRSLLGEKGSLVCVFGCGGDRDPIKRPMMGQIAGRLADKVWITSDNPRTENPKTIIEDILSGIDKSECKNLFVQIDRRKAIQEAIESSDEHSIVLIAGKGHEDYQIIGTTKYPFSDSEAARQALNNKHKI